MSLKIDRAELEIVIKNDSSRKRMREVEDDMRRIRKEMKGLDESSPQFQGKLAELKKAQAEYDKLVDKIGIAGMSMKELRKRQQELNAILAQLPGNSPLYAQYRNQLEQINNRLRELRVTARSTESSLSRLSNGLNKYFAMGASALASITGVVFGAKELVDANSELSDSFADVSKTTGLTTEEVSQLYKEFKNLNTRTPRSELLKLAADAGKLGIEGRDNILAFVDAGNQINVALGEDLGEDAIKSIGKMVGVYDRATKELQGMGLKEQMLAVGSAVNSIGQSSSASEPYLVSFAGRLGGISKQAGIGIDSILGYASALDQDMQQVEMSATALSQFFVKVMSEPEKFARLAKMEVSEFSALLKTDANEAFKMVLKSMNAQGGFQSMIPIFEGMGLEGSRAVAVLSSLAGSMDKVEEAQRTATEALIEGNSVTNEYDIRNNNLAASLNKLNQNVASWFKNSSLTNWLSKMVSGLEEVTRATKTSTEQFDEQSKSVVGLVTKTQPMLDRYDKLITKTNRSAAENKELKRIISEVTSVMPGASSAFDQYGNAIAISTGRVREFITAEIARLKVVNKDAIEENRKELEKVTKEIEIFKLKIDEIRKTGSFTTTKSYGGGMPAVTSATPKEVQEVQQGYQLLISKRTGYEAEISRLSGASLEQQLKDADKARKLQEKQAQEELKYYAMSKSELKKFADEKNELAKKIYQERFPDVDPVKPDEDAQKKRIKLLDDELAAETLKLKNSFTTREKFEEDVLALSIRYTTKKRDVYAKGSAEWTAYENQLQDIRMNKLKDSNEMQLNSIRESNKAVLDSLEVFENAKRNQLQEEYNDELITKEQYEAELLALEIASAEKRLQNAKTFLDLISQATFDSEDAKKKAIEDATKTVSTAETALISANAKALNLKKKQEKDHQQEVAKIRKELGLDREVLGYQQGLDALREKLKAAEASEKETADAINSYKLERIAEYADEAARVSGQLLNAVSGFERASLTRTEIKYQKQIDAAKKAGQDTTAIEEQKEKELAEVRAKYADGKFILQIAQIGAETARAAIIGYAEGMTLGGPILAGVFAGAATLFGLSQIAVAKSERDAAKAGYKSGGYTGSGNSDDEVAGNVHKNEFVVQAKGVRNPHVRKFLDVFNAAQLNGTVHMLNTTQILERVRTETVASGYKSGGYAVDNSRGDENTQMLVSVMGRMITVTDRLSKRLDDGIEARAVISGKDGVHEQTQRYLKYIRNASRTS